MIIKSISEIHGSNVNWAAVGQRIQEVRLSKNLTKLDVSEEIGCAEGAITCLEKGLARKNINHIFRISQAWDLSLNWLLNGIGECHDADPIELIPETLIVQKGAGIRKTTSKASADKGEYSEEAMEFVIAMDKYMRVNEIPFPSKTQIFEIFLALGYRKCVPARIAPLGYNIAQQKKIEQLKSSSTIKLLNTLEIDIRTSGDLALPDEALEYLDYAVVSIHSSLRMNKTDMTKRVLAGLSHPKAKILAHPTGRLINKRPGFDLDWDQIFSFCGGCIAFDALFFLSALVRKTPHIS